MDHASLSDKRERYPTGAVVEFKCKKCYSGGGLATCEKDGTWSRVPPCKGTVYKRRTSTVFVDAAF